MPLSSLRSPGRSYRLAEATDVVVPPIASNRARTQVPDLFAEHGGRYLIRGGPVGVLEGSYDGRRSVVFEFPSMEVNRSVWNSPEYVEVKKLREGLGELDVWAVPGVGLSVPGPVGRSVDDGNDLSGSRINQDGAVIHDGVAIGIAQAHARWDGRESCARGEWLPHDHRFSQPN
jgi:uncharacterized protein (DUF1330 family)